MDWRSTDLVGISRRVKTPIWCYALVRAKPAVSTFITLRFFLNIASRFEHHLNSDYRDGSRMGKITDEVIEGRNLGMIDKEIFYAALSGGKWTK